MKDNFHYSIDLSTAKDGAEKIVECLRLLRRQYDLRRFEFTKHVRVAPTEIPHSHPILTLNTQLFNPDEILCEYLHEQMHWYEEISGCVRVESPLIAALKKRYPQAPIEPPEGARDEYSTYLHLLVNWLEIEAASQFLGSKRAQVIAHNKSYYRWIYRTVLSDWRELETLFRAHNIVPMAPADQMIDRE
jgi:hypothetical protein